jgi:hypothetical protein
MPGSPAASAPLALSVNVPPHVFAVVTGAATVMAAGEVGKVSVNVTPVRAVLVFGFVIVNVSVEFPVGAIELGEKDLLMDGGAMTVIDALAEFPVPPFVEVTAPVVLFFAPAVAPVTVALKVQLLLAAIKPPLNTIVSGAVTVKVPPHCAEVELATVNPAGKVSANATPVRIVPAFGFVIVKLNVVVPFNGIVAAPKDLLIDGGATTVTLFEPVLFASLYSSTFPLGSTVAVFARSPAAVGVTKNVTLNELLIGIVTPPIPAAQLKVVPAIEQLIAPIGAIPPLVTVNAPCG